jgi:hypothetical protein
VFSAQLLARTWYQGWIHLISVVINCSLQAWNVEGDVGLRLNHINNDKGAGA